MKLGSMKLVNTRLGAATLAAFLTFGGAQALGSTFQEEGSIPGAETAVPSGEAGAPAEAAPVKKEKTVDEKIAEFNEGLETPRSFSEQERGWIELGAMPDQIDRILSGDLYVPTGDPYKLSAFHNGELVTVESNPKTGTPPAADNVPMYATEVESGERAGFWVPKAASKTAVEVDAMFNFIMWINYIFTAIIGVLMVVFCIKYRRRPGVRADQTITHNTPLEIFWSVIPTILCAIMFWGGYTTFLDMRTPPPDAMQVKVNAFQWGWKFNYDNGVESTGEFHVPENTPIEMLMTSNDVIHSFHLPAFRQKSDILPNRYTKVWFDSGEPATYRVYCSEYCGRAHGNMYAKLVVEPREDYEKWLEAEGNWTIDKSTGELKTPLEIGTLVYTRQACKTCHSIDGSRGTGPSFAGLWDEPRSFDASKSKDATPTKADENYIRKSILNPHDQIVDGYGANMTVYNPMLPEVQIFGIIEFIKSLKDVPRDADNDK